MAPISYFYDGLEEARERPAAATEIQAFARDEAA